MSCQIAATELIASDAFWHDSAPVSITAKGMCLPADGGAPDHHLLFATSGSSGVPKWIALSKSALLSSADAVNTHLGVCPASVWGLALPLQHVGGFGVVARSRAAGCALEVFPQAWDAHAFAAWAAARRITHTSLVPTQVHDLVAAGCGAPADLVAVVVGGGRLDFAVGQAARTLGWPVLASYGMTEAASQIATQPLASLDQAYVPSPIPLLAHWRIRVDVAGCLEIAGPALFSGMVIDGAYQPRESEWYGTLDRITITPEGLVPAGRADALVKIAGELVDPQEVESHLATALQQHGRGIAIIAMPEPRLGHRLVVVAERSIPSAILAAAIDAQNASVPRSQRLGEPRLIDEMPRGDLGKIQRSTLCKMLG